MSITKAMGYLRNILLTLLCLTVGNTVFAAAASLFENEIASYVDPRLAKIQANFAQDPNDDLTVQASSLTSTAILDEAILALNPKFLRVRRQLSHTVIKKSYLFTFSGTSPPSAS